MGCRHARQARKPAVACYEIAVRSRQPRCPRLMPLDRKLCVPTFRWVCLSDTRAILLGVARDTRLLASECGPVHVEMQAAGDEIKADRNSTLAHFTAASKLSSSVTTADVDYSSGRTSRAHVERGHRRPRDSVCTRIAMCR